MRSRILRAALATCFLAVVVAPVAHGRIAATIDLNAGEEDVLLYGGIAGDGLSESRTLVTGDVTGDGIPDIIVAAPDANSGAGAIYIYEGGSLGATLDVAGTEGPAPDVVINGADAGDALGSGGAIAVGDVDGDLVDDLVFASFAAGGPANGRVGAGEAYVVYGSNSLPATIDLASGDEDVLIYGATAGDGLGDDGALVVFDCNNDTIDDIVLGAPGADGPGDARLDAGEAYVILGSGTLPATVDLNAGAQDLIVYGATAGDFLTIGGGILGANVNGDSFSDLILTTPGGDGPAEGRTFCGEVYVLYGSTTPPAVVDLNNGDEDVIIYGATSGDQLTVQRALRKGDFNGDGTDDLLIATEFAAGPGDARSNAGEAYVVLGGGSLPATIDLNSSDEDTTIYGGRINDQLTNGGSLSVADINGDTRDDIILGDALADGPSDARSSGGDLYVVYGRATMPATVDFANDEQDVVVYGASGGDQLTAPESLFAADVDADGFGDLIIGAPVSASFDDARPNAGEVYVIHGDDALPAVIDLALQEEDTTIFGATSNDFLGLERGIRVADVNGDGVNDILLAAPAADGPAEGRVGAGEVYVIYGVEGVPPTADTIVPATTGPTNAATIDVTITFSEDVVNFNGLTDLVISTTGTAAVGAASFAGGPAVYTVTLSSLTGQGTFTVAVNANSDILDLGDNPLASSVTSAVVTLDRQAPAAPQILTNDGMDFTTGFTPVTVNGLTDPDTDELRLNGSPIAGYVSGATSWTTAVPLNTKAVATPLSFTAVDAIGNESVASTQVISFDAMADADGDTLLDIDEGQGDPDNDGIPNYLDPDSDNDGVSDLTETELGTDPYDPDSTPLPLAAWPLGLALAGAALWNVRRRR